MIDRTARHRCTRLAVSAAVWLMAVAAVGAMAPPAAASVFSNPGTILIPGSGTIGPASPYPSTISVSGLSGTITDVNATLAGLTHTYPDDIDVLLVGPFGQTVVLMSDVGDGFPVSGVDLAFDDSASTSLPDQAQIVSGTDKPSQGSICASNLCSFSGPPPAPPGPYGSALSIFNGTTPNGTWDLYAYDETNGDSGSLSGGWSIDITTNGPTITSFTPLGGAPGTSVIITGTNFTGATAVTFGGVAASAVTVDLPTQITTTVPAGAHSGPIAVTTPNGTATSAASFAVTPAPTVASFTPTKGLTGTTVVITGSGFTGATAVKFGGTPSASFTVDSDIQVSATVPIGAGSGPISVTNPTGTGTSASDFVVKHQRHVSLSLSGKKAAGSVDVADGFSKCASDVPVKVQHLMSGKWHTVGSDLTSKHGAYSVAGVTAPGKYRALARGTTLSSGDVCLKAHSPVAHQ